MFYVGQEVVAIKDHSQGFYKKGDEFIIEGIKEGCEHYPLLLNIGDNRVITLCNKCMNVFSEESESWYASTSFAPKIDLSEFTSESLIEELEQELVNV